MDIQLSLSHLGYLPDSPKILTLLPGTHAAELPPTIPFYLRQNCLRMLRDTPPEPGFSERFPAPYDLLRGKLLPEKGTPPLYQGELRKISTRWGELWQADFSAFQIPGSYQIETNWQVSPPFAIHEHVYDRIVAGYLGFLRAQRCGCSVFGVHDACHLDDGVLDTDGTPFPVTGGWHDAGDFRKWMAFTLHHVDALLTLRERLDGETENASFPSESLLDELRWGNRFFQRMIDAQGHVYEDVAGGSAPAGSAFSYEKDWWFENHPGCFADASDNRWTDNVPQSGDERKVRTTYNPFVQWTFTATQARASRHLPPPESEQCLMLARRAADYAHRRGHDNRTLFLSAELRGRLELIAAGISEDGEPSRIAARARELMHRQARSQVGLSGFFLEANAEDAFRSIAFSAEPAFALLSLWEQRSLLADDSLAGAAKNAVLSYIEDYLLADSGSNPFSLTPYGVYLHPPHPDQQLFREAGGRRGVRTFMHPFNAQGIVHGTSSVLVSHAHLLARAAVRFQRPMWRSAAERLLHWCLGHNVLNRSLFSGIGYRQPFGYSFRVPQLADAMVVGFIGRPDDTPYLEESSAIEWNTLEYWSIPYLHAAQAVGWLRR